MLRTIIAMSALFIIVWSCDNDSQINDSLQKSGDISLSIDMSLAPAEVVGLKGLLKRNGFESIPVEFEINDNEAIAEVEDIVSGEWDLSVQAFEEDGNVIYQGSTRVIIVSGELTTVFLHLDPSTGSLKIIVTWGDWPTMPVAYFPFNGNDSDKSGNENHGDVFGAILTEDRFGNPDNAFQLDGSDDFINIGNNPIVKPQFPIAISAWINVESFENHNPIFTNNFDDGEYFGMWLFASKFKTVSMAFGNGGLAGPDSRRGVVTVNEVLEAHKWIHVVGILRSSEAFDIFINGEKVETRWDGTSDSTSLVYNDNPASIGRSDGTRPQGNTNHFHGKIDELYIFDTTLSQDMIDKLVNSNN